jgi:hypothetical protein
VQNIGETSLLGGWPHAEECKQTSAVLLQGRSNVRNIIAGNYILLLSWLCYSHTTDSSGACQLFIVNQHSVMYSKRFELNVKGIDGNGTCSDFVQAKSGQHLASTKV